MDLSHFIVIHVAITRAACIIYQNNMEDLLNVATRLEQILVQLKKKKTKSTYAMVVLEPAAVAVAAGAPYSQL